MVICHTAFQTTSYTARYVNICGGNASAMGCTQTIETVEWMQRAIPLFNYIPLQMTINGVQGGIGNMSPGGCHLNPCPGGLEGIIEACPGGSGTT